MISSEFSFGCKDQIPKMGIFFIVSAKTTLAGGLKIGRIIFRNLHQKNGWDLISLRVVSFLHQIPLG